MHRIVSKRPLTAYADIERWWELVCCAYLMISMQAVVFRTDDARTGATNDTSYSHHPWWDPGTGWKHLLNNVRLIIQPYIFYCVLTPWLTVFDIPSVRESLHLLMVAMNNFHCIVPI